LEKIYNENIKQVQKCAPLATCALSMCLAETQTYKPAKLLNGPNTPFWVGTARDSEPSRPCIARQPGGALKPNPNPNPKLGLEERPARWLAGLRRK